MYSPLLTFSLFIVEVASDSFFPAGTGLQFFNLPVNNGVYLRITGTNMQEGAHYPIEWSSFQRDNFVVAYFGWTECTSDGYSRICCKFAVFHMNEGEPQLVETHPLPLFCQTHVVEIAGWFGPNGLNLHVDGYPLQSNLYKATQVTTLERHSEITPLAAEIVLFHSGTFLSDIPPLLAVCDPETATTAYTCIDSIHSIHFRVVMVGTYVRCPLDEPDTVSSTGTATSRSPATIDALNKLDSLECNPRVYDNQGMVYYVTAPVVDTYDAAITYCAMGGASVASLANGDILADVVVDLVGPVASLWAAIRWNADQGQWTPTDHTPLSTSNMSLTTPPNPSNLECTQWIEGDGDEYILTPTACDSAPARVVCRKIAPDEQARVFEVHFPVQPLYQSYWKQEWVTEGKMPDVVTQATMDTLMVLLNIPSTQMLAFRNFYITGSSYLGASIFVFTVHSGLQGQLEASQNRATPFDALGKVLCSCEPSRAPYGHIVTTSTATVPNPPAPATPNQLPQGAEPKGGDEGEEYNNAVDPVSDKVINEWDSKNNETKEQIPSPFSQKSDEEWQDVNWSTMEESWLPMVIVLCICSGVMFGVGLCIVICCVWARKKPSPLVSSFTTIPCASLQGNATEDSQSLGEVSVMKTLVSNDSQWGMSTASGRDHIVKLVDSFGSTSISSLTSSGQGRLAGIKARFTGLNGHRVIMYATMLGRGGNGEVFLGEITLNGQKTDVAIKLLEVTDMGDIMQELMLMLKLRHPNVVSLYDVHVSKPKQCDERQKLYLVMELMGGGDLSTVCAKQLATYKTYLPMITVQRIATDILQGLAYLHSKSVTHRDVKPQNVLVNERGVTKLADFGASSIHVRTVQATTIKGTPKYLSPEAVDGQISHVADIWAFGLTMLDISCKDGGYERGKYPHPMQLLYQISTNQVRPHIPDNLPDTFKNMVSSCFLPADQRRSASQLLVHPFLTDTL